MGSTHSPCLDVVGGLGTPPVVPRDAAAVECSPLARALAACMPQARVPSPCGSGAGSGSGSGSMGECDVGTLGPSPDLSGAMTDGACHVFLVVAVGSRSPVSLGVLLCYMRRWPPLYLPAAAFHFLPSVLWRGMALDRRPVVVFFVFFLRLFSVVRIMWTSPV